MFEAVTSHYTKSQATQTLNAEPEQNVKSRATNIIIHRYTGVTYPSLQTEVGSLLDQNVDDVLASSRYSEVDRRLSVL